MENEDNLPLDYIIDNKKSPLQDIENRKKFIYNFFNRYIKDNYDKIFILVLLAAFIIRVVIYFKTNQQALWWDAADYLATGKRWGLGLDTIDIWYYRRGFLWPLITAFFFKIGLGELSMRFLVVLISTGIVFLTYLFISEMFDKKLAILTSIPLIFSWVFLFFTGRLLIDLPSSFFFLFTLLFFWKGYIKNLGTKYFYLFGLFYGLTCMVKMQYLMFAPTFLAMAIVKEKWKFVKNKRLWISILMFVIIIMIQMIMHYQHFGNPVSDLTKYYLGIGSSQSQEVGVKLTSFSNLFVYFKNLPYILDGNNKGYSSLFVISPFYILFILGFFLFFIDLFLGIDKIFQDSELQKRFFILFMITSVFLFLGYIAPHLEQRYIMSLIPFLFLISVYPIYLLIPILEEKFKIKDFYLIVLISIILILLLIPNYNFGFDLIESKKNSYMEVKMAGEWIKKNSIPSDIIIGSGLPQLTYYSERSVYPFELSYRRDLKRQNESGLDDFIIKNKPKYLVESAYEPEEPWAKNYPLNNQNILVPVQAYPNLQQPLVIIYKFNY
ncbi:MAG: glycosyltransferase family 39 protein [Nanoarchaeota archaeon]